MSTDRTTDEETQYRNLILPAYEKDPWIDDWDSTMAIIDDELVPAGTQSERDTTNPSENNLFYNTDTGRLQRYNGTSWEDASPSVDDISSIQSSSDVDHDSTTGGTSGNPHSNSASTNHGNESHSDIFAIDGDAQPPETHDNTKHSEVYLTDIATEDSGVSVANAVVLNFGNNLDVADNGGGTVTIDSSGGNSGEIDLIDVETIYDLPDGSTLSKPTIAYVNGADDYVGIFQQ